MDRRSVLKAISLSAGSFVATPTLFQVLTSCNETQELPWTPKFLDAAQAYVLEQLTDVILPKTDTVGALDVHVPEFIDLLLNDVVAKEELEVFLKGANAFQNKYRALFKKDILKAEPEDMSIMVSTYFDLDKERQEQVLESMHSNVEDVKDVDTYYIYKYLNFIRYYTLFAYLTTQEVKEGILGFNPYLGTYTACTTL